MGTPYNPARDPDALFRRPRIEERQTVHRFLKSYRPPNERPSSAKATEGRPADDFSWQDFLTAARAAADSSANP
jgi:hypothetical protein